MNFVRNFATFEDGASKLRVEIMVKKIRTMLTTLNEIWVIGSEFFLGGTRHPCGPNTSVIAL